MKIALSVTQNRVRSGFLQAACWLCFLWIAVAPTQVQGAEPPSARQVLEQLGYEIVEKEGTGKDPKKEAVRIDLPATTPLRVVSTTIKTSLASDANSLAKTSPEGIVSAMIEFRYGKEKLMDRDIRGLPVRMHWIVLDSMLENIHDSYSEARAIAPQWVICNN